MRNLIRGITIIMSLGVFFVATFSAFAAEREPSTNSPEAYFYVPSETTLRQKYILKGMDILPYYHLFMDYKEMNKYNEDLFGRELSKGKTPREDSTAPQEASDTPKGRSAKKDDTVTGEEAGDSPTETTASTLDVAEYATLFTTGDELLYEDTTGNSLEAAQPTWSLFKILKEGGQPPGIFKEADGSSLLGDVAVDKYKSLMQISLFSIYMSLGGLYGADGYLITPEEEAEETYDLSRRIYDPVSHEKTTGITSIYDKERSISTREKVAASTGGSAATSSQDRTTITSPSTPQEPSGEVSVATPVEFISTKGVTSYAPSTKLPRK